MANDNLTTKKTRRTYPVDLTGLRFGRLTVVKLAGRTANGRQLWECTCTCGRVAYVRRDRMVVGHTQSCGCLHTGAGARHGRSRTTEHSIWCNMNSRCNSVSDTAYARYGGRGIKICKRWSVFENFLADVGLRPTPQHSLDRIDNDGDYTPENVRWATARQQAANTRRNVRLTHNGITHCLSEWARITGLRPGTLWRRLSSGWTIEQVLLTPVLSPKEISALGSLARWGSHGAPLLDRDAVLRRSYPNHAEKDK